MAITHFDTRTPYTTASDIPAILQPENKKEAGTEISLPKDTIIHFCSLRRGKATFDVLSGTYARRVVTMDVEHMDKIVVTAVKIYVGND